jgi:hypothetical protein
MEGETLTISFGLMDQRPLGLIGQRLLGLHGPTLNWLHGSAPGIPLGGVFESHYGYLCTRLKQVCCF